MREEEVMRHSACDWSAFAIGVGRRRGTISGDLGALGSDGPATIAAEWARRGPLVPIRQHEGNDVVLSIEK